MHDEEPECEMEEKQKNDIQYIIEKVESYCTLRTRNSEEELEKAVFDLITKYNHHRD